MRPQLLNPAQLAMVFRQEFELCAVKLDNEIVLERGKFVDPKMIVPPAWG
jgi:hypothetical protein